jgi:hypothetical protein
VTDWILLSTLMLLSQADPPGGVAGTNRSTAMSGRNRMLRLVRGASDDAVTAHRHARFRQLTDALLAADTDAASTAACRALLAFVEPSLKAIKTDQGGDTHGR